jgi:hypothetical protein
LIRINILLHKLKYISFGSTYLSTSSSLSASHTNVSQSVADYPSLDYKYSFIQNGAKIQYDGYIACSLIEISAQFLQIFCKKKHNAQIIGN